MIPSLVIIGTRDRRRLPPVPVPLLVLWPLVVACLGLVRLLDRSRPNVAAALRAVTQAFRELRGLTIDVSWKNHEPVRIRFI